MKKLFCFICLLFLSSSLWANVRYYRINPETVTAKGYAIAWGVRDLPVDFESIEQSDESIQSFILQYDTEIVNYIVDIEREIILKEIASDSYFGHLGNYTLGNNYSAAITEITNAEGLENGQSILLLTQNWKWDNSITDAYIVEKNATETKYIRHFDLKDDVKAGLNSRLSLQQRKILENKALHYWIHTEPLTLKYTLSVEGEIPKCDSDCELININVDAEFSITDNIFKMDLKKIKFQIDRD